MRFDFPGGRWVARDEGAAQFLRLCSKLLEVGMLWQNACRQVSSHNELLSCARCPLARAEKSSSKCLTEESEFRGTLSFPRTRRRPENARKIVSNPRPELQLDVRSSRYRVRCHHQDRRPSHQPCAVLFLLFLW